MHSSTGCITIVIIVAVVVAIVVFTIVNFIMVDIIFRLIIFVRHYGSSAPIDSASEVAMQSPAANFDDAKAAAARMREKTETGGGDCAVDLSSSDELGEKKDGKPEDAELAAGSAPKKKPVATAEKDRRENMALWAEMRKAAEVLASNGKKADSPRR